MYTGASLASVKSEIFEALLGFLPDWVQITVLALVVLAVVGSWAAERSRHDTSRRRRFLSCLVAAPTLAVATKIGLDAYAPGSADAAIPTPPAHRPIWSTSVTC